MGGADSRPPGAQRPIAPEQVRWHLLRHAINGLDLPRSVTNKPGALPDVVVTQLREKAVLDGTESWFEEHPDAKRHHALVDARALREAWLKVNSKERL
ncbi:hypothetical protein GCM10010981_39660 [Dyella nitratireducens]|uniref:Uncharacterized protein n=1 Tax=Dyella nitratireducens TaxID=1849580 RepID=A0ABQ1GMS0_9GAMM|nr:hypothetical protein GCM10010981_39660 [Dyella nitratireducens]GLQ41468.1 hypothetical protein GCM10007902_13180 [Dyella nitratireducens]